MMKRATFLLVFMAAAAFNACSGGNNPNSDPNKTTEGQVVQLTATTFKQLIWDYSKSPNEWIFMGNQPCIIDFYADWCRPCKMVAPIMVELSNEYKGKVRIYKVNTDEQRELAKLFNINSIPAVLFVPKTGKPQMSVGAMQKTAYLDMIKNVLKIN
ncbi:MAG: thioredoxin [Bacteroidales bacterium]|nr:thioredoxin [Bacteroidales bacterium]MDD4604243.1 thioredoxin [Bacteroidales bacterium]